MTTVKTASLALMLALAALMPPVAGTVQAQNADPVAEAASEVSLPLHIGGRTVRSSTDPTRDYLHQWPGVYFESRFKGPSVTVRLKDDANKLDIYIDGTLIDTETKPGIGDINFGPLADSEHTIRLEIRTESQDHAALFSGFFVPDASNVLPAPDVAREIEFIGDSYTVGYGNTSTKRECSQDEIWATTDTQLAFGPLTAKHFAADYRINAVSGRGMVRNYNGGLPDETLRTYYPYGMTLHGISAPAAPQDWQPQIIVIGLGTNDFSTPLNPGEKWPTRDALHADYESSYVAFVKSLRASNPKAFFILMATDQADGEIQAEVRKVIAAVKAGGDDRIDFVPMNGLSFGGCDWHPTTADDQAVAKTLTAFIDAHPELWQGN